MNKPKIIPAVAHPFPTWLPLTMTWAYNQIKHSTLFSSIILTNKIQNMDQFPWEPIYSFQNKSQRYSFKALKKLGIRSYPSHYDSAIKKHNTLILHSHFGDRGWHDIPIAKNNGLKHVVTFYGYDVSRLPRRQPEWKERYKELFDKADLFLFEGPHMAKCVMALGCPEEKIKVQRLGVEVDKIPFKERELGKDGMINILISGTFNEKKGIPYALEALGMLINEYPNIRITIIGDSAGQERQEQEKKIILDVINKYELAPLTRMLGFQPHNILMQEAYNHHIFLSGECVFYFLTESPIRFLV